MEADLLRWYGVDYRDRWTFDADGRRRLTLRRIWTLLEHSPPESAVRRALGGQGWTVEACMLADLLHAWTGQPHPDRLTGKAKKAQIDEKVRRAALRRKREREAAIARGDIT